MTEPVKATRATVFIGSIEVDGFQLPDGAYRMSQTQAAECVGRPEINARRFLSSKAIKALLGDDYTPDTLEIESELGKRGGSRFNALPLEVVTAYWINQCFQGNRQALALVIALATETLERRARCRLWGDSYRAGIQRTIEKGASYDSNETWRR